MGMTLDRAQRLVARAVEAAAAQSVPIAAVVVDEAGNMRAAAAMDETGFMSLDAAHRKARTAANLKHATQDIAVMASKDRILEAALHAEQGLLLLAGGVPFRDGDKVIGALGIAGGHYMQDQAIADYALSAD